MKKIACVEILMRDPEGVIQGVQMANGYTEDDGVTVIIPNGYAPNIHEAVPADISVTVIPPPTANTPAELLSRVDDAEANISTLTFNLGTTPTPTT